MNKNLSRIHVCEVTSSPRMADSSSSHTVDSVIRGHHIYMYKAVWTPYIGEELCLEQEHGNYHSLSGNCKFFPCSFLGRSLYSLLFQTFQG